MAVAAPITKVDPKTCSVILAARLEYQRTIKAELSAYERFFLTPYSDPTKEQLKVAWRLACRVKSIAYRKYLVLMCSVLPKPQNPSPATVVG